MSILSSMEASIDRRGFLDGGIGIGRNSPNGTEAEATLDPWLEVFDITEFCDLWDVYDACREVLEVCGALLAVDESSSSACMLGEDRPDEGRNKELTVDVSVETAVDFLGELNDHLENALVNFFAGLSPLPSGNRDAGCSGSGGAGSGFVTEVTTVEASLHSTFVSYE